MILVIVRLFQDDTKSIFYNTEWSVIAIILFGQSVVKFSSGISNTNENVRWQFVALIISLIIIFGLVPSVTILILNLINNNIHFGMYIAQFILFLISCFVFFIIGSIGQKMLDE
ncbi:hypothetical protein [Tenacibaculum maritimum]|uniref:hypothetical protein n=1 Tax=Tenacibaculum maritimum TaxID=107401 RepID=UPI0010A40082|nr:hypothetical protein [Tenacibaculum maritimum]